MALWSQWPSRYHIGRPVSPIDTVIQDAKKYSVLTLPETNSSPLKMLVSSISRGLFSEASLLVSKSRKSSYQLGVQSPVSESRGFHHSFHAPNSVIYLRVINMLESNSANLHMISIGEMSTCSFRISSGPCVGWLQLATKYI